MSEKEVAIITGASKGIGLSTAVLFQKNGYKVYALSRSGCNLVGVNSVICDICDEKQLKNAIDKIYAAEKRIDVLVNNAGMGISGSVEKTNPADARKLFELNFFALFEAIKYTIPYMRERKYGKIINVGSVAGSLHVPFQAFYSASKAAVEALSNCLRGELEPFGIKVAAVLPGDTSTNFTSAREKDFEKNDPDYGERIYRSIKQMEEDEQNGMPPEKVARIIYKAVRCKSPKPVYIVGFQYKFFIFLGRIFSKRFVQFVLNKMYA